MPHITGAVAGTDPRLEAAMITGIRGSHANDWLVTTNVWGGHDITDGHNTIRTSADDTVIRINLLDERRINQGEMTLEGAFATTLGIRNAIASLTQ